MVDLKLRTWRGSRRLEEVASTIGVTAAMWSRWENGRREIPAGRCLEIEALTGISRHDLRPDIFGPADTKTQRAVSA